MGMVSLPDKSLADAFENADYLLVVRRREDGKNEVYRATPEQVSRVIGNILNVQGIKTNLNNLKVTASDDGRGTVTISLGGKTEWQE